jgi:hypothetical protein
MIGKPISCKGFAGCIRYLLKNEKATLLEVNGVRMQSIDTMTQDFNIQRGMNPGLGKAAGHLILSWSKQDQHLLSPIIMAERAREYLKLMNIGNTQYIIVQHRDTEHPHLHIVYNRVNNLGKTISDSYSYLLNVKVSKQITLKYGYHMGEGKQNVNRDSLKRKDKFRYELYDAITQAGKIAANWQDFKIQLKKRGIEIWYKYRSGTKEIQGISFSKGKLKMKGSAIDRGCSYSKLNTMIENNWAIRQKKNEQFVQSLGNDEGHTY